MTKYPLSNGLGLELASGMVGWLGSCDHPPLLFAWSGSGLELRVESPSPSPLSHRQPLHRRLRLQT